MAYFSNSIEGSAFYKQCFYKQCAQCIFGKLSCPIFLVQLNHNYSACNNKEAREILDELVSNNGDCAMWKEFSNILDIEKNPEYPETKMQMKIRQLDMLKNIGNGRR